MRALPPIALLAALMAGAHDARGNGRYPTSQFLLVGPGASSEVMALRTTFGLVESLGHLPRSAGFLYSRHRQLHSLLTDLAA